MLSSNWTFPADLQGWAISDDVLVGTNVNGNSLYTYAWDGTVGRTAVGSLKLHQTGSQYQAGNYEHVIEKTLTPTVVVIGDKVSVWIKHDDPYMSPIFYVRIRYTDDSHDEAAYHPDGGSFDWRELV